MRKLLVLISFIPLVSMAQPMPMPPGHQPPPCQDMGQKMKHDKPKHGLQETLRYIELSEPQRNEINYLLDQADLQMREYRQKHLELKAQLESVSTSLDYDNDRANDLIKQIADLTLVKLQYKVETQQKVLNLLTEQQKATLAMQKKISMLDRY